MSLAISVPRTSTATSARARSEPSPFTLPHFRAWASGLILDTGESWHPEPFQEAFLADVFAGYPECWLIVPEGNGKTTLVAGLALYHAEFRPHASVLVAASSRDQAGIVYRQAEGFVLRSPRLYESCFSEIQQAKGKRKVEIPRFVCLEGYRRINHFEGGRIQVLAADEGTGDGVIPTLAILDELHRHRSLGLYRTWTGKLQKRSGQIVTISTAGEPGSEFELMRDKIRQTAELAKRDGSFLRAEAGRLIFHEWAVPEKGDVADFGVVKAANPLPTITLEALREKYNGRTMTLAHWRRMVCNLPTRGDNAAIQEAEWRAAATTDNIPDGTPVWLGLDVAWKWDTTAAVPLWYRDHDYRLLGPATILVPPRDGTSLDPNEVERALVLIHDRTPIHTVVMDMSRAEQLAAWIVDTLGATVIDRQQTNAQAVDDFDKFMEALRSGWLKHSGDVGLTRHALNAVAKVLPFGDARFDRVSNTRDGGDQDSRVIDALIAAAMVHSQAASQPETEQEPMLAWR